MALPQSTLDDLQVYATKPPRKDDKNNPMRMDVLSAYFAAGLLQLEKEDTIVLNKKLVSEITKHNAAIRKEMAEKKAKAEEEAEARVKAEAEAEAQAEAKARARRDEDFPTEAELNADNVEKYEKVGVCLRFDT